MTLSARGKKLNDEAMPMRHQSFFGGGVLGGGMCVAQVLPDSGL
jgi:hypothetical protein